MKLRRRRRNNLGVWLWASNPLHGCAEIRKICISSFMALLLVHHLDELEDVLFGVRLSWLVCAPNCSGCRFWTNGARTCSLPITPYSIKHPRKVEESTRERVAILFEAWSIEEPVGRWSNPCTQSRVETIFEFETAHLGDDWVYRLTT